MITSIIQQTSWYTNRCYCKFSKQTVLLMSKVSGLWWKACQIAHAAACNVQYIVQGFQTFLPSTSLRILPETVPQLATRTPAREMISGRRGAYQSQFRLGGTVLVHTVPHSSHPPVSSLKGFQGFVDSSGRLVAVSGAHSDRFEIVITVVKWDPTWLAYCSWPTTRPRRPRHRSHTLSSRVLSRVQLLEEPPSCSVADLWPASGRGRSAG